MKWKITFMLPPLVSPMVVSIWTKNGPLQGRQNRNANGQNNNGTCLKLTATSVQPLSSTEAEDLVLMRMEEKLARDVYTALYKQWGVLVFNNIAQSEQLHLDAVGTLIDRYGVVDPAADDTAGMFANSDTAAPYVKLTPRCRGLLIRR